MVLLFLQSCVLQVFSLSVADGRSSFVARTESPSAVTCLKYNASLKLLMVGTQDGQVHVVQKESVEDPTQTEWTTRSQHLLHDCEKGVISGVELSQNTEFIISAARDGTVVMTVCAAHLQTSLQNSPPLQTLSEKGSSDPWGDEILPLRDEESVPEVEDIIGTEVYSIDEAQIKESERLAAQKAEQKKRRIRSYIDDLRSQLQTLKEENKQRPKHQRLPGHEFEVDKSTTVALLLF